MHSLNVHYFRVYFPLNMSNRCSNRPKTSYKHSLTSMRAYIPQGLRLMIRYHRLRQDSAKKVRFVCKKLSTATANEQNKAHQAGGIMLKYIPQQ